MLRPDLEYGAAVARTAAAATARGCAVKVARLIENQLGWWIKAVRRTQEPVKIIDNPRFPFFRRCSQTEDATVKFLAEAIIRRAIESARAVED